MSGMKGQRAGEKITRPVTIAKLCRHDRQQMGGVKVIRREVEDLLITSGCRRNDPCLCRDMAFCKTPAIAFRLPGCGARPGLMGIFGKDHSPENGTQIHTKPCIRV